MNGRYFENKAHFLMFEGVITCNYKRVVCSLLSQIYSHNCGFSKSFGLIYYKNWKVDLT